MHVAHVVAAISDRADPDAILEQRWALVELLDALATQPGVRHSVIQVAPQPASRQRGGVDYLFVTGTMLELQRRRARSLRWLPAVARRTQELQPDIMHVQGFLYPLLVLALRRRLPRTPLLVQDRAGRVPRRLRRLYRWAFRQVDAAIFTSHDQARPFLEAGILRSDVRVVEIPGSSTQFKPANQQAARDSTGLHGDPCLLWVGHLDDNKDPLTILRALSISVSELPDPHLWCFFTTSPIKERVEAAIAADAKLRGRVHLMGTRARADLQDCYRAADLFVLGSHREGGPFAAVEALACGTPLVVTDIPAFRRFTSDGDVGGLFPPGDAERAARQIIAWSRRDRGAARHAARMYFHKALSYPAIAAQLRAVYESLLP